MLAAYASRIEPEDPLSALEIGDVADPQHREGWTIVEVRAASLNHHDLWSLRGVGLNENLLPMVLGCDAAGIDEAGREVVVHGLMGDPDWRDDETLDPQRTLLSERHPGTFAQRVAVPNRNLVAKPATLSFDEAACLPTAWLTAYRMLFVRAEATPGQTVLVQGAAGGVAGAAIALGRAAGLRVWATSRDEDKRSFALELGAHAVLPTGERLPEKVDIVVETVGEATWSHSLRSLKPGGTLVVSGATSGANPPADLQRVFFHQQRVIGSTMGTLNELKRLISFCAETGVRPHIDRVLPLADAREAFAAMATGDLRGKIVLRPPNLLVPNK